MNKILILVLSLLLLVVSSYLIVQKYKNANQRNYNETHICELEELSFLQKNFALGDNYQDIKKFYESNNYEKIDINTKDDILIFELRNILRECPKSKRPYCGVVLEFRDNRLSSIEAGYPCH